MAQPALSSTAARIGMYASREADVLLCEVHMTGEAAKHL